MVTVAHVHAPVCSRGVEAGMGLSILAVSPGLWLLWLLGENPAFFPLMTLAVLGAHL